MIIFVTGLPEYMQKAFDVRAYHYLVKPVDDRKFIEVLNRAVQECERKWAGRADRIHRMKKSNTMRKLVNWRNCFKEDFFGFTKDIGSICSMWKDTASRRHTDFKQLL